MIVVDPLLSTRSVPGANLAMRALVGILFIRVFPDALEKCGLHVAVIGAVLIHVIRFFTPVAEYDMALAWCHAGKPFEMFAVVAELNQEIGFARERELGIDDFVAPGPKR